MEVHIIDAIKSVLEPWKVHFCIVNDAALKYYNVPTVLYSLEICVDAQFLSFAESQIRSYTDIFKPISPPMISHANNFEAEKMSYPQFEAFIEGRTLNVTVFPDTFFHLGPLENTIVDISKYPESQIKFSQYFDYSTNTTALSAIPVPRLASLLQGLAQKHFELEHAENDMATYVEQLVDGMNLDEAWCLDHLDTSQQKELDFVLQFIKSKGSRLSQSYPSNITRFVATEQDANELRMIPGYGESTWSRELGTRGKKLGNDRSHPLQTTAFYAVKTSLMNHWPPILRGPTSRPVNIQYMSDLHLEMGQLYTSFDIPRAAPYLILAGDTGCLRNYEGFLGFLAAQCAKFERVFLVLGNHEFFGITRDDGLKAANSLECEPHMLGKLSILNRGRVDINRRVTILGCTLHTHIPEESQLWVRMKVSDFGSIKDWTVDDHNAEHLRDLQWLKQQLREISLEDRNREVVIVTHHSPTFSNTADPKHKSNQWSSAFCTELLESQVKSWDGSNNIRRWIFGHTHWNTEFRKHGMVVSSNQRGYINLKTGNEPQKSRFSMLLDSLFTQSSKDFIISKVVQV